MSTFFCKIKTNFCLIVVCKCERWTCIYIDLKQVSVFLRSASRVYEFIWKELSLLVSNWYSWRSESDNRNCQESDEGTSDSTALAPTPLIWRDLPLLHWVSDRPQVWEHATFWGWKGFLPEKLGPLFARSFSQADLLLRWPKTVFMLFCQRWAPFLRWFSQILPGFPPNQNFWGCACTPASYTTAAGLQPGFKVCGENTFLGRKDLLCLKQIFLCITKFGDTTPRGYGPGVYNLR